MSSIRAVGVDQAVELTRSLSQRLADPRRALEDIVDTIFDVQDEWWQTLGRGGWPADSPITIAQDRRRGLSVELMRDTGDLHDAATHRGATGQRIDLQDDALVFTVTVPYAEPLAENGRGAVAEPTQADAERYARAYLLSLRLDLD